MDRWIDHLLRPARPHATEADVLTQVDGVARSLGFEYCALGMRFPLPLSQPRVVAVNNYPVGWQQRYAEQNYIAKDPSVAHCSRSDKLLVWSDSVFDRSRQLWSEARSFGLNVGWAQGCHDGLGVSSMLTLARSGDPLRAAELANREADVRLLAHGAHQALLAVCRARWTRELGSTLTDREIEVLRWAADGKVGNDIAMILDISQATVRFHIKNVLLKTQSTNLAAAIVKAMMLGLLRSTGPDVAGR